MAYQPNIPASTDLLSQSQADIQNNFIAIGTLLSPNGNAAVTLPVAAGDPTTSATNMALYTQTSALTARPEMYILRNSTIPNPNGNPPNPIEFTSAVYANPGWTRLPSGILLKWGTFTVALNSTASDNFIVGPGAFTTVLSIQMSFTKVGGSTMDGALMRAFTTTNITIQNISNNNAVTVYYLVLGI